MVSDYINKLSNVLREENLDSVIMAVGSSTFPLSYWNNFWLIKERFTNQEFNKSNKNYHDIDLRILPAEMPAKDESIYNVLQCFFKEYKIDWKHSDGDGYRGYVFKTFMDNRTQSKLEIDLLFYLDHYHEKNILCQEDFKSPDEILKQERLDNNAFSLLYTPKELEYLKREY